MKNYKILAPDDFDIKSALSTGKVAESVLTSLFVKRGILISPKTKREERADYFASFFHGYSDFETISAQHSKVNRSEFCTALSVNTTAKASDVRAYADSIKSKIEADKTQQNITEISIESSNNQTRIKVRYQEYHPDKQMFAQFENKEALITVEANETGLYIQRPANDEAKQWVNTLVHEIQSNDPEAKVDTIDLTGITDPVHYWNFFDQLTSTLTGYQREDVVDVYLRNPKNSDQSEDGEERNLHRIDSASYKGMKLHESKDFIDKLNEGFHLYNMTWDSSEQGNSNSDKFRLSVKFTSPDGCSGFSFIPKGFLKKSNSEFSKDV
jgi:hypothetical protein